MAAQNDPVQGRFYPSIFIGVGGAGTTVVEKVYRRLHDTYRDPRVLRTFQFLAVDTRMRAQQKSVMPRSCYRTFGGFDGREWVRTLWPKDEFFRRWWWRMPEAGRPYGSKINDKGAGARRIDGRLCLLANMAGGAKIDEAIRKACDAATDILESMSVPSPCVSIYICNSLSGGTGSGMFIDLAFLLRERLADYKARIYGFFLAPAVVDLWANDLQRERRTANAYAALSELDFWQNQQRPKAPYHWRVAGRDVILDHERPFDLVHLIDTSNRENKKVNDYQTIINAVADMIFYLAIGQASEDIQGPLDNLQFDEGQETFTNRFSGERRARTYGSGAVATLRFPVQRFSRYAASKLVEAALPRVYPEPPGHGEVVARAEGLAEDLKGRLGLDYVKALIEDRLPPVPSGLGGLAGKKSADDRRDWVSRQVNRLARDLEEAGRDLEGARLYSVRRTLEERLHEVICPDGSRGLLAQPEPDRLAVARETLRRLDEWLGLQLNSASNESLYSRRDNCQKEADGLRGELEQKDTAAQKSAKADARQLADKVRRFRSHAVEAIAAQVALDVYGELRSRVHRYREVLDLVLGDGVRRLRHLAERTRSGSFTGQPEDHGLVVEVLGDEHGRKWLEGRVEQMLNRQADRETAGRVAQGLLRKFSEVVSELDRAADPERVLNRHHLTLDELVDKVFEREAEEARKEMQGMTVWQALVEEARSLGADNPEAIRDHILKKVEDLAQRALPLWYVKGTPYEIPIDKVTILASATADYRAAQAEWQLPELGELVRPILGDFTPVEATWPEARYEVTVACLEYGVPVGFFAPLAEYRRAFRKVSASEQVPLLSDGRFVTDDDYLLSDPAFAAADPARLAFLVGLHVQGTVARDQGGTYFWTDGDGRSVPLGHRAEAVRAFRDHGLLDGRGLGRKTALKWNRLPASEQAGHLMRMAEELQEELTRARLGGAADSEVREIEQDLNAVKSALQSELYHI